MEDKMLKFTMCAGKSCCPVLTQIEDQTFTITDDYEGKVVLTKEELKLLKGFLDKNLDQ
jgi:hypothetical protein